MVRVICPLLKKKQKQKNKKKQKKKTKKKLLYLTLFRQSVSSANIDQSAPNLVKVFMSNIYVQQKLNEFDHGSDWTGTTGVICS